MLGWRRSVSFVNARVVVPGGIASRLRFASRVLSIDTPPRRNDCVVDLGGAFVLPGLINAHDHLELNHYGALKRRERYENASEWIEDLEPVIKNDSDVRRNTSYPLEARLFIGGLKNVLAGVTTVAHHNPFYRQLDGWFPVRVVKHYGWAHSFHLQGRPVGARGEPGHSISEAYAATAAGRPFLVHIGEGVDDRAAAELPRLEALGCVQPNTVLVHGVAITGEAWRRVASRGASLVWCPASNLFLFGRTAPVAQFFGVCPESRVRIAVGSDSRLTGAGDLLQELRVARQASGLSPDALLNAVTAAPARALRLPAGGRIAVGEPADLLVLPALEDTPAETLLASSRRDVSLVTIGGAPLVGAPAFRGVFRARRMPARSILVDGEGRLASARLGVAIARSPIQEPGVEVR